MAGQQDFVLPFSVNLIEVAANEKAVASGLSAIRRFFRENIWSPLGANIRSIFVSGAVGDTGHLSDAHFANVFPDFEPERWEEELYLWLKKFFFCILCVVSCIFVVYQGYKAG